MADPQLSCEVRWFARGDAPRDLREWFESPATGFGVPVGGGVPRTDVYLALDGHDLGVKQRGDKAGLEVKGRLDRLAEPVVFGQARVAPQLFCKWTSTDLQKGGASTTTTVKTRWLRKFECAPFPREVRIGAGQYKEDPEEGEERPAVGCNVELTSVLREGVTWWTFGAESFAFEQPGWSVELSVRALLATLSSIDPGDAIDLRPAEYKSYPEWLAAPA